MRVLFFHGLDSNSATNKFTIINNVEKFAFTVDYRKLTYIEVSRLYDKLIEQVKPDILIGHSIGGYWALKKSHDHKIPSLSINPTLDPRNIFSDYIDLRTLDLNDDVKRAFHLELHDEVINMHDVEQWLDENGGRANIFCYNSKEGHHRVHFLDEINYALNELIKFIEIY